VILRGLSGPCPRAVRPPTGGADDPVEPGRAEDRAEPGKAVLR